MTGPRQVRDQRERGRKRSRARRRCRL